MDYNMKYHTDVASIPDGDLRDLITALRDELKGARTSLENSLQQHRKDIATISEALIDEAERRNWCDEYDRFVEQVNESLTHELQTRVSDFTITQTYTVTRVTTISARDYDDAQEKADEDIASGSRDLVDPNWDITCVSLDDTDIEKD